MATPMDVPSQHVAEEFTTDSLLPPAGDDAELKQLIEVKSGPDRPENAFTVVK